MSLRYVQNLDSEEGGVCACACAHMCMTVMYLKVNNLKLNHRIKSMWSELWIWIIMSMGGEMEEDISSHWNSMDQEMCMGNNSY